MGQYISYCYIVHNTMPTLFYVLRCESQNDHWYVYIRFWIYIVCVCRVIFDRRRKIITIELDVVNNIAINYRFSLVDNLPATYL